MTLFEVINIIYISKLNTVTYKHIRLISVEDFRNCISDIVHFKNFHSLSNLYNIELQHQDAGGRDKVISEASEFNKCLKFLASWTDKLNTNVNRAMNRNTTVRNAD